MRLTDPTPKEPIFNGNVKITISGIDQHGQLMSGNHGGLKAKYIKVWETTLDEVYKIVYDALSNK